MFIEQGRARQVGAGDFRRGRSAVPHVRRLEAGAGAPCLESPRTAPRQRIVQLPLEEARARQKCLAAAACARRSLSSPKWTAMIPTTMSNARAEIYNACSLSILARVAIAHAVGAVGSTATGVLQSLSNAKLLYKTMRAEWSYAFEVEL